jgi:hypothetical protein
MSQLITGLFTDHPAGHAAADALKHQGFSSDSVRLITKASGRRGKAGGGEPAEDSFAVSLTKAGISKNDAARFADGVRGGGSLVTVVAGFGQADRARKILSSHGTSDLGSYSMRYDDDDDLSREPAPFSKALGLPLLSNNRTPFSTFWSMSLLSNFCFSKKFGWRLLWHNATPFSEKAGWRVLSDNATPLSSRMGWRVLDDNPTPLSSKFGWPVLSERKFFLIDPDTKLP